MVIALAVMVFAGALVVGFADYPQSVAVRDLADGELVGAPRPSEVVCPGPLRPRPGTTTQVTGADQPDGDPGATTNTSGQRAPTPVIVWPPEPEPCDRDFERRKVGTWLAMGLSTMAGLTALALLHRSRQVVPEPPEPPTPLMGLRYEPLDDEPLA